MSERNPRSDTKYSARRVANKGIRAEVRVNKKLKCKVLGGPGRADYDCKGTLVENKHRDTRAVHAGFVKQAHRQGAKVLNASGRKGFSKGAKKLASELGIKLTRTR